MSSLSFLQGNFPTQGSDPGLLHCRKIIYHQRHQGSLYRTNTSNKWKKFSFFIPEKTIWGQIQRVQTLHILKFLSEILPLNHHYKIIHEI